MDIPVGPAAITIHSDDEVLVCDLDAKMSSNKEQGYFAADTRFVSGYRLKLGRVAPVLLNSAAVSASSARFEFTNPELPTQNGTLPGETLHLRLDRAIGHGLHEDYDVTNYSQRAVDLELEVSVESDFADLFDVKSHVLVRRGTLQSRWDEEAERLTTTYRNGPFVRTIELRVVRADCRAQFANGGLLWRVQLEPQQSWHTCLLWCVDTGEGAREPCPTCHALGDVDLEHQIIQRQWAEAAARFSAADAELSAIARQAVDDLANLRIHVHDELAARWPAAGKAAGASATGLPSDSSATRAADASPAGFGARASTEARDGDDELPAAADPAKPPITEPGAIGADDESSTAASRALDPGAWVPAAGVPWFVSLFGRDALVVSLQTLSLSPRFALGALRALGALQADAYDDERDMQPGKIEHEVRHGELATLHLVPHTPYYGTHDATTLYVLTAAEAFWWHGDRGELDAVRPHVERALAWIDRDGDIDGDGLQEYRTRAKHGGYYNQGWKDSGEAIVHADGTIAPLPIALVELQAYVVAAKRAWARILDEVYGETTAAARLTSEAARLADQLEQRFWWEEEGTYYLGLDGDKRPIASVASNAAHVLWAGAAAAERAPLVARRLLADDMWSGWGIRTLSARHPSYNPFSYQLGSVWPHDNAIAVAGFRRYGLDEEACQVARGILDAGRRFLARRLPELFAGLARDEGAFPVQYLGANVPQAWAAGSVIHLFSTLLGLRANAMERTIEVGPCLPAWLESIWVENLQVGDAAVDLVVRRDPSGRHELDVSPRV
jgi:glycogen debranching enzyme